MCLCQGGEEIRRIGGRMMLISNEQERAAVGIREVIVNEKMYGNLESGKVRDYQSKNRENQ